jgi:hypothetical protein
MKDEPPEQTGSRAASINDLKERLAKVEANKAEITRKLHEIEGLKKAVNILLVSIFDFLGTF